MSYAKHKIFSLSWGIGSICLLLACGQTAQSPDAISKPIIIEYIANEGVLIQCAQGGILIDAVHAPYRPQYAATPDSSLQKMLNGQAPFQDVSLSLVSHVHRDHQSSGLLLKLLAKRPKIKLIAPKQVVDSMEAFGKAAIPKASIISLENKTPQIVWDKQSIQITSIPIPHTYPQLNSWVQHYAYLIKVDGKSLLHLGDTYAVNKHLKTLRSAIPDTIDVAMVPFWFLYDSAWEWLKQDIYVRQILAIHVPIPDAVKLEAEMEALDPKITVFRRLGERKIFD